MPLALYTFSLLSIPVPSQESLKTSGAPGHQKFHLTTKEGLVKDVPGLTETVRTQPWAKATIRPKGESSTPSPVPVVEAGS